MQIREHTEHQFFYTQPFCLLSKQAQARQQFQFANLIWSHGCSLSLTPADNGETNVSEAAASSQALIEMQNRKGGDQFRRKPPTGTFKPLEEPALPASTEILAPVSWGSQGAPLEPVLPAEEGGNHTTHHHHLQQHSYYLQSHFPPTPSIFWVSSLESVPRSKRLLC